MIFNSKNLCMEEEDENPEEKNLLENLKSILDTKITNEESEENCERVKNFLEEINNFLKKNINEGNFTNSKKSKIEGIIGLIEILKIFNKNENLKKEKKNIFKNEKKNKKNFFKEFNELFFLEEKNLFFKNENMNLSINSNNDDNYDVLKKKCDLILEGNFFENEKFTNLEIFENLIFSDDFLKKIFFCLKNFENLKKKKK